MSDTNDNTNKNERALEALLAAAFRLNLPEEISNEQAEKFFQQPSGVSQEDKEAINSWGTDFIENLLENQRPISNDHSQDIHVNEELKKEYFAMNRDKDGSDLDDEVRREIEKKRKDILDEEKNIDQNNES